MEFKEREQDVKSLCESRQTRKYRVIGSSSKSTSEVHSCKMRMIIKILQQPVVKMT